jgi:SAM-dependent methyltransferase
VTTGSPANTKTCSAIDLAQGFQLASALWALDRLGILQSLEHPVAATPLAAKHGVDCGILEAVLQMLAARTDLVARRGGKYRLTHRYDAYARFVVRQYLGTYGPNAVALDRILRDPSLAADLIDRRQHAKAFDEAPALSCILLADLIVQLGLNHVLDLGCGTGMLLRDLAGRVPQFQGWGLDINPAMCAAARKRLGAARPAIPPKIFRGDSRDLAAAIPAPLIRTVRTLTAASLANEFFADGTQAAVQWLSALKAVVPGRTMLIADYYGRLGQSCKPWPRDIALHDFVQVISGQGVPPPNLAAWKKIYRAARCRLIHVVEDHDASYFVHVLKL